MLSPGDSGSWITANAATGVHRQRPESYLHKPFATTTTESPQPLTDGTTTLT